MTTTSLLFVCVLLVALILTKGYKINDSYVSNERRLYHHLLRDYQKAVRPVSNETERLPVRVGLTLRTIDLNEKEGMLYATGWLRMSWPDFQLRWNSSEYGEVTTIHLPITSLWSPDLAVTNGLRSSSPITSNVLAIAHDNGRVISTSPLLTITRCRVVLTYFPFDTQYCSIRIESWSYQHGQMDVDFLTATTSDNSTTNVRSFDTSILQPSKQWKVIETSVNRDTLNYTSGSFVIVGFRMRLQRYSTFAVHLFLVPTVSLSLVIPAVFVMPAGSTEKITLGIGVLTAHVLLLGELIDFVPSEHHITLPLMAHFFVANIVLVSLSLIISSIIVNFWSRGNSRLEGPSAVLRLMFLNQVIIKLLCFDFSQRRYDYGTRMNKSDLSRRSTTDVSSETVTSESIHCSEQTVQTVPETDSHLAASGWLQLADVIDRLFLILYLVVVVVLCLGFLHYL